MARLLVLAVVGVQSAGVLMRLAAWTCISISWLRFLFDLGFGVLVIRSMGFRCESLIIVNAWWCESIMFGGAFVMISRPSQCRLSMKYVASEAVDVYRLTQFFRHYTVDPTLAKLST